MQQYNQMKRKNIMKKALLVTLLALPVFAQAATNVVVNGSFEDPVLSAGTFQRFNKDGSFLPGWDFTVNSPFEYVETRNALVGSASEGVNFAELDVADNASGNSEMTQSFLGLTGTYSFAFDYSARELTNATTNGIQAWWNGDLIADLLPNGTGQVGNVWSTFSTNLVATGNDTLLFKATGTSDGLGASLDNVVLSQSVAAVPEPETYGMMLAGLAMLGFVSRRRRSV
jgi:hypothetical protein